MLLAAIIHRVVPDVSVREISQARRFAGNERVKKTASSSDYSMTPFWSSARDSRLSFYETIDAFFTPDFQCGGILVVDFHTDRVDRKIVFLLSLDPHLLHVVRYRHGQPPFKKELDNDGRRFADISNHVSVD